MKNFFKILLAVVALAVVGCTTDTTEDLGVQIGDAGQATISLSLEGSRTELGTEVDGLYPLYWSAGDKISVNGIESGEAMIDSANPSSATFTIATASAPYCVAYPAAAEGQVKFAAEQSHASNTSFGSGVAAMYGYSENGVGVQLHHLTGVLKIAVAGASVLTYAQISTVDRAPIAGAFDIDFTTGKLTPSASATHTINYEFPSDAAGDSGLVLSSEPQYIHIAVPAGVYNELYITLYDDAGGVMYATVKADDEKPLAAGSVRKFSEAIIYTPNESVFVVKDVASLKEFAGQAATLDKDVLFVADVDMTGESWTPIEGYAGTIHGNGYAIKGMTAPLFGITNASIKGLHLRDVNISETKTPNVGAFARRITATDTVKPFIEHCSVSGKIVVECKEYVYKEQNEYFEFSSAGLVGSIHGVDAHYCSSSVELHFKQCVAQSNAIAVKPGVGGCFGSVDRLARTDGTNMLSNVTHCSNTGNITINNGSYNGTSDNVMQMAGGVIGIFFNNNRKATAEYWTNSGNITIDGVFTKQHCRIGGVAGWIYSNGFNYCTNTGNLTFNSGSFATTYLGGIVGYAANDSAINNALNKGKVIVKKEAKQTAGLVVGGVSGYSQSEGESTIGHLADCVNDGEINIEANMIENTEQNYFRVGGIAGWSQCYVDGCTNNADINISGNMYNAQSADHSLCVAGIVGYKTVDGGKDIENNGDINISAPVGYGAGSDCRLWVAGVFGYAGGSTTLENAKNTGDLSVTGAKYYTLYVSGISSYFGANVTNAENTGKIEVDSDAVDGNMYISGCIGVSNAAPEADAGFIPSKLVNRGSISVNAGSSKNIVLGGCVSHWNQKAPVAIRAADNYGPITVKAQSTGTEVSIGGIIGYMYGTSNSRGLHNHKSATINVDVDITKGKLSVAGLAYGLRDALDAAKAGEPANGNDADIFVTGSSSTSFNVAGGVSIPNNYNRTNITNNGNITITGAEVGTDLCVGGFEADHDYGSSYTNCENNGNIFVDATTKVQQGVYIGGLSGGASLMLSDGEQKFNGYTNSGDITFNGEAGLSGTGDVVLGGCMSSFSYGVSVDNDGKETPSHDPTITATGKGFANSGKITYGGKLLSESGNVYIGGILANLNLLTKDTSTWTAESVNTGDIIATGTFGANAYVGGIFGATNKSFAMGKVDCDIDVPTSYTNVGMLIGTPRSADVIASNCKVRGSILGVTLNAENYFDYLYGGTTDWTGVENYDGCVLLTE